MVDNFQERQVAIKVKIDDINKGKYVVEEGWKPNYLLTKKDLKVSRVNLVGIIVNKERNGAMFNLVLDDGSGQIKIRSFEEIKNVGQLSVGNSVLIIGKIRMFQEDKYVSPELIKKIDSIWLKIRNKELQPETETVEKIVKEEKKEERVKETAEEEKESLIDLENKKIIELIKELDLGDGALIEEIKDKVTIENPEELIDKMLKNGEIFQNLPGKVKVL